LGSKTFVAILENQATQICAYSALTLAEVDTAARNEQRRKKLPRLIRGVRLGRLAVDQRYQSKRLGELLLMESIERVRRIHEHAGVVGLFVDAIDDKAAQF
jgi:GNAT superfamily N-acetyltransferase